MKRSVVALCLAVLVSGGCYSMTMDATALEPRALMAGPADAETVESFETREHASWYVFGLIDGADPDVAGLIAEEVATANAVGATNIQIRTTQTLEDFAWSTITLGLFARRTIIVTGELIR